MDKKLIAIIGLSLTTVVFLFTTVFFIFGAVLAQENFEDQIDVTRLTIQGYESLTEYDFEKSEYFMEDAMNLQQEILERNGLSSL